MNKYNIEGGLKFYEELYKMLDEDESSDQQKTEELCLITNEPLGENFVTLECNHKFNYMPLFNDIRNHKKKFNSLEVHHLKQYELRCPYCRNKQNKLLPYYESMGISMKVIGVNALPEPPPGFIIGNCAYNSSENSLSNYCSENVMLLDMDGKTYCSNHYHSMKYKLERLKIKKEKEEAKKKAKEEAKKEKEQAKQEAKLKSKEDKDKEKENNPKVGKKKILTDEDKKVSKKTKVVQEDFGKMGQVIDMGQLIEMGQEEENVVVSSTICAKIVKFGPNKGQCCKCKVYLDGLCKRHYNILNIQLEETHTS